MIVLSPRAISIQFHLFCKYQNLEIQSSKAKTAERWKISSRIRLFIINSEYLQDSIIPPPLPTEQCKQKAQN